MLCYLKFELKKSWLSTFIFSAPIFGYQRKESFTKLQLKSLIIHIDFSNQLMWLWIVINSGESIVHAVAFKYIIFKLSDVSCIMKL